MDAILILLFLILILIIVFVFFYQQDKKIRNKAQREGEERQRKRKKIEGKVEEHQIAKRNELYSSIFKIIETDFNWDVCSRCNEETLSFLKFNSVGTSIYVECETCGKKTWHKAKEGFEKGQEIIGMWEETKKCTDLIGDIGEIRYHRVRGQKDELNKNNRKPIPQSVKDKVWNRDDGKCVECGGDKKLEFDHIIPISKGGSDTYRNLQLLCENCNRKKSNKIG